jgi:hypothetical protein
MLLKPNSLSPLDMNIPHGKSVFSITRICSRTRDRLACVAPAKNIFISLFIVKRDNRMRDAGRWRSAGHPHAWACLHFSAHFRVGRTHRYVLTIVYTVTWLAKNKNSNCVWSAAWTFKHAGQPRMREQTRMTLKTPLGLRQSNIASERNDI